MLVLEDFNVVELDVVIVLAIVLVLREAEVELVVHGIAVFPDIEARVESCWLQENVQVLLNATEVRGVRPCPQSNRLGRMQGSHGTRQEM